MQKFLKYCYCALWIIFTISLIAYGHNLYNVNKSKKISQKINETFIKNTDIDDNINQLKIDYNNEDILAVLKIDDFINIPIVKTIDNDFYLHNDIYKNENILGAIFMDYRNNSNDKQINIYGHNARYHDIPFRKLISYMDYDFYLKHQYIELFINNKKLKYKITNITTATKFASEEHLKLDFETKEKWLDHFNKLKNNELFETNDSLKQDDKILILQTCILDKDHDKLLLIIAKLVN